MTVLLPERWFVNVFIRQATSADIEALVALNQVVQELHAELEPENFSSVVDADEVRAFFSDRLADADSEINLAELGGRPVGYIWSETQQRPQTPFSPARRRIYVHHIAVESDVRRAGVASALMRSVET